MRIFYEPCIFWIHMCYILHNMILNVKYIGFYVVADFQFVYL